MLSIHGKKKNSLNGVNYELNNNERSYWEKENKKRKSSACCGLSGVCGDSIVTHQAIHFYRASQLPETPFITWPVFWHRASAPNTQLSERILTFYWQREVLRPIVSFKCYYPGSPLSRLSGVSDVSLMKSNLIQSRKKKCNKCRLSIIFYRA